MKINTWFKNLIYLFAIAALFYGGIILLNSYKAEVSRTFQQNYLQYILITLLFFGGIGVVLGFDHYLVQMKKKGMWRINIPKLLIVGLPSLILSIPPVLFFIFNSGIPYSIITCVVFGHTLISSVYKQTPTNE